MSDQNLSKNNAAEFNQELNENEFRVTIFGSARTQKDDQLWKDIFELAKKIGERKWDVVTGGGPGLMEAASAGHEAGDKNHESDSIGLTIELPFEAHANKHLDMKKHFQHFSGRLDHFMVLSNAVIVTPGGIGTCLELFYTWQLTQVKHICPIPIILLGDQWHKLLEWVKEYPLERRLVSPEDLDNVFSVSNNDEVMEILEEVYKQYESHPEACINLKKYKLDQS